MLSAGRASATHATFDLPTNYCPVAHCSIYAGSQQYNAPPASAPSALNTSDDDAGKSFGLGCTSNGTIVACTYGSGDTKDDNGYWLCASHGPIDTLVVYNATGGTVLYRSGCLLGTKAQGSVPIISTQGHVIMTDATKIIRLDNTSGSYPSTGAWSKCRDLTREILTGTNATPAVSCDYAGSEATTVPTLPGAPVSPILTTSKSIVVFGTQSPGYIFAFYSDDLTPIARRQWQDQCAATLADSAVSCYYETRNTPAASFSGNNRFYISMNAYVDGTNGFEPDPGYGVLLAFDVNESGKSFDKAWNHYFGGPSGASPAVLQVTGGKSDIFFDGQAVAAAPNSPGDFGGYMFKVTDNGGTSYTWQWATADTDFQTRIPLSFALDTGYGRNCAWAYAIGTPTLKCFNLSNTTANASPALDASFSVATYSSLSAPRPASGITLTHPTSSSTVMLMGLNNVTNTAGAILAMSVSGTGSTFSATQYWESTLTNSTSTREFPPTQFPLTSDAGFSPARPVIVCPTTQRRARFFEYLLP